MRRPRGLLAAAFLVLASASARAEDEPRLSDAIRAGRAYFADTDDRWRGRKDLKAVFEKLAAQGVDPLRDLELLREFLYQSRSFAEEFTNKKWQKENDVDFTQSGPYSTVGSERMRFTYVLPTTYPKAQLLKKPSRPKPYPLLFVFHEAADDKGSDSRAGEEVLKRWWPKDPFAAVYESWMMLAPTAPRGNFVKEDGTVKKELATDVFAEFWKPHHVDFERVVLDGSDAALAMAAAQPVFFAGLILRGGKVDPDTVKNFAPLPVYVAGDPKLKEALTAAGHPNVTAGPASGLPEWLAKLASRKVPAEFAWKMRTPDQLLAHWVSFDPAPAVGERTLAVKTDRGANQIRIDTSGIQELTLFLNDDIVDLDREVEVVVNGQLLSRRKHPRSFDQLLDKDPISIRRSFYLGWLYPVVISKIAVGPDGTALDVDTPASTGPNEVLHEKAAKYWDMAMRYERSGDWRTVSRIAARLVELGPTPYLDRAREKVDEMNDRLGVGLRASARHLLRGQPELIHIASPADPGAFAWCLRDLWWRPESYAHARRDRCELATAAATGLQKDRWAWLLGGGTGTYPLAAPGVEDPDPVLTALVADRMLRDRAGHVAVVRDTPLRKLAKDPRVGEEVTAFLRDVMEYSYRGPDATLLPAAAERYASARDRNGFVVVGAVLGLLVVGFLVSRSRPIETRP